MAEQLLGPPQCPADLDDDREVPYRARRGRSSSARKPRRGFPAGRSHRSKKVSRQSFAQRDGARISLATSVGSRPSLS